MYAFTNQFMSNDKNVEFLKAAMMGPNGLLCNKRLSLGHILCGSFINEAAVFVFGEYGRGYSFSGRIKMIIC
jgi:hypothetical protein